MMDVRGQVGQKLSVALLLLPAVLLMLPLALQATIFGNVRGIVHDPEHRPIAGAEVQLHAAHSDWAQHAVTDDNGEFAFPAVPIGEYEFSIRAPGFEPQQRAVMVQSGSDGVLHFALKLRRAEITVEVHGKTDEANRQAVSTITSISRQQIAQTPGADRTNSLAMVTDYVPGAYMIHDQLHVRGGHGFEWLLDGVPVPNTSIATNVGPQFDPKDIDYLEMQRGGLSAEYGSRSYGVFNVVTRSGFEREREGELVASYGNLHATDDQLSFGSHTARFAYYASLSGNRSDLGLEPPTSAMLHDQAAGGSAFASLIFNHTPSDQLRLVTALRGDHYQVPNTPEDQQAGIRDVENERDAFVNFSWLHTYSTSTVLTVSPFFHFNRAHYLGGVLDPIRPESNRASTYSGGVLNLAIRRGRHSLQVGGQAFAQHDSSLFALTSVDAALRSGTALWGGVESVFVEDQYKPLNWLTVSTGGRFTRFGGGLAEQSFDPRLGAAVRLPRLNWVLHGFFGHYYQPPPLSSVGGPVLALAATQGFGFLPLRGEHDTQYEAGLRVPLHGWTAEFGHFQTKARDLFDHDVLGNSNIFFPLTLQRALIRGWEASVHSPRLSGGATVNLVYSRQVAQWRGSVTGGLTDFTSGCQDAGWCFLDHDQRHTASLVGNAPLPWKSHVSAAVAYGSGFVDGDGPGHLPAHTTLDVSLGKRIGERLSLQLSATNVTNRRYLLDNSNTFGGTHFANPRQVWVQVKYRFHY